MSATVTKREAKKARQVLADHNQWRRAKQLVPQDYSPVELGVAIDDAVRVIDLALEKGILPVEPASNRSAFVKSDATIVVKQAGQK